MPHTNPSPSDLLRRYRRNVYPPVLKQADQETVRDYLEERGFEPRVGAVAVESGLKTETLIKQAMANLVLPQILSAEDAVVGPHSLGEPDAISLWTPKVPVDSSEV